LDNGGATSPRGGLAGRILASIAWAAVLVLSLLFSVVIFSVLLVAGLVVPLAGLAVQRLRLEILRRGRLSPVGIRHRVNLRVGHQLDAVVLQVLRLQLVKQAVARCGLRRHRQTEQCRHADEIHGADW